MHHQFTKKEPVHLHIPKIFNHFNPYEKYIQDMIKRLSVTR